MSSLTGFSNSLVAARRSGVPFTPGGSLPESTAEAYKIQKVVADAFGETGAFKAAMQGAAPAIFAPIRADLCFPFGAEVAMPRLGVELEVGWLVTAPLPDPDAPDLRAQLVRAVRPVPVIELLERRIAGPLADVPVIKLADGLLNWGLVVGSPLENWDGKDFGKLSGSMRASHHILLDGKTTVPGGSALATLEAFLEVVGDHFGGLRLGQVVITGTLHPMTWIDANADVRGEIHGLGSVEFALRSP